MTAATFQFEIWPYVAIALASLLNHKSRAVKKLLLSRTTRVEEGSKEGSKDKEGCEEIEGIDDNEGIIEGSKETEGDSEGVAEGEQTPVPEEFKLPRLA